MTKVPRIQFVIYSIILHHSFYWSHPFSLSFNHSSLFLRHYFISLSISTSFYFFLPIFCFYISLLIPFILSFLSSSLCLFFHYFVNLSVILSFLSSFFLSFLIVCASIYPFVPSMSRSSRSFISSFLPSLLLSFIPSSFPFKECFSLFNHITF